MSKSPAKNHTLALSLILIGVILSALYYYIYVSYPFLFTTIQTSFEKSKSLLLKQPSPSPNPSLAPSHSPYPLVPDAGTAGTYNVSQKSQGSTITKISIDPLDARQGDTIKVQLTIKSRGSIEHVKAQVVTDEKPQSFKLTGKSITQNEEVWEGSYKLTSPILYKYIYTFEVKDSTNTTTLPMALRN